MAPSSIERAHLGSNPPARVRSWSCGDGLRTRAAGHRAGPAVSAADPVFAALGDPTRREVLRKVAAEGGCTATQLAAGLPVSRQAVVKHLQVLAGAGLVAAERHGREQRYRLTPGPLDEAVAWIAEVGSAWDRRLARLRTHLDEPAEEPTTPG